MTCATKGCEHGVFRDHLCAPCYHRAEQQREDLIRRKAAAFDRIEALLSSGMLTLSKPDWPRSAPYRVAADDREAEIGLTLLDAVEAMEERG